MKLKALKATASLLILAAPQVSKAEDINEIFKKVNTYVAEQNFPKALEELSWAKKEIEKLNSNKIGTLLPASVNGFTGGDVKVQSALGFDNIERTYTGNGKNIQVSVTGGGGAGGPMGGLAGLARMGMMMGGQQPGMDSFRLEGRTANLDTTGGRAELTVFLDSGAILKVEGSGLDGATLKSFAEGLKISNLDNYLKGTK